jgi:hypothetical protein
MGRVVAPGESLWTDDDRSWAVALLEEEGDQCGGCGSPLAETTDPDHDGMYRSSIVRCHRCTEMQSAADEHYRTGAKPGFLIRTQLRDLPALTKS